jgi:hypothetical protein
MMIFKNRKNLNLLICEEEFCEDESTQIWANSESKIVDLCDLHYSQVKDMQ